MARITIEVSEKGIKEAEKELKKLGKTGAKTDKQNKSMSAGFVSGGKSLLKYTAVAGGVATAIIAIGAVAYTTTSAIAAQTVEMDNLSRISNQNITDYNNSAFAAEQYGLSVSQLSDAFKDTRERVGEFIATFETAGGSGALNDFADVMGMTKDETLAFAKEVESLSGKDILVKMTSMLEDAGASSAQMSFALEGMASDLTAITPLLANSGKEMERLSLAMASVTVPITSENVDDFRGLNEATGLLAGSAKSLLTSAILPMIPAMTELSEATAHWFASMNAGTEAQLSDELVDLTDRAEELREAIADNETAWGRFTNVVSFEGTDQGYLEGQLQRVNDQIDSAREKLGKLRVGVTGATEDFIGPLPQTEGEAATSLAAQKAQKVKDALSAVSLAKALEASKAEAEAKQAGIDGQVLALQASYLTELEIAQQRDALIISSTLTEQEQLTLRQNLWGEYYRGVTQDAQDAKDAQAKIETDKQAAQDAIYTKAADAWSNQTADLKSNLGEQNALYKASAIVNATIQTYEAANAAYAALAPIPYVGPALGAAAAGVAIASGLANVSAIQSARMQGGDVTAGTSYTVGERGAETFTPTSNGTITANHQDGTTTGGLTLNVYNYGNDEVTTEDNGDGTYSMYIRRDELPGLMSQQLSNASSQPSGALQSTFQLARA